jgi:hypothetical protein
MQGTGGLVIHTRPHCVDKFIGTSLLCYAQSREYLLQVPALRSRKVTPLKGQSGIRVPPDFEEGGDCHDFLEHITAPKRV